MGTIQLKGFVYNERGEPQNAADISFWPAVDTVPAGAATYTTTTNADGMWTQNVDDTVATLWDILSAKGLFKVWRKGHEIPPGPVIPVGIILPYVSNTAPSGWLFCYGQAVSRTTYSALFALISTTFGAGDGVTTFNVPDMRGRVPVGSDAMGGVAASRVAAATLTSSGGAESSTALLSHTHGNGTLIGGTSIESADHAHLVDPPLTNSSFNVQTHTHTGSTAAVADHADHWTATGSAYATGGASAGWVNTSANLSHGAHSHTVTIGNESAQHAHTVDIAAFASGGVNANHTHTVAIAGSIASAGSGSSFSLLQPYLTLNYLIRT